MNDQVLNLLGLCRKSGKLSLGHDACKLAVNNSKAKLCLVCSDASQRLREEMAGLTTGKEIETFYVNYSMLDFKKWLGFKAAVVTVDDEGFAKTLKKKLNDNASEEERGL